MQWSKLKLKFEKQLAFCLVDRLTVHVTEYGRNPRVRDGRGWFLLDGTEIVSVEAPGFTMKAGRCQFSLPVLNHHTVELGDAIGEFLNLDIDSALESDNHLIRGLSFVDRRFGKRRLRKIEADNLPPFESILYSTRLYAEGLISLPPRCPSCGEALLKNV